MPGIDQLKKTHTQINFLHKFVHNKSLVSTFPLRHLNLCKRERSFQPKAPVLWLKSNRIPGQSNKSACNMY